jgi:predicted permease
VGGVIEGFVTLGLVIGLGALLAHVGVLDDASSVFLSRLSFFVASPALMVTVLGDADVATVLSRNLAASAAGVLVAAALYVVAARLLWRKPLAEGVVGTLSSCYVNAGNLGLPVAAYVLGDAALVAPTLLLQLLVLQPLGLALLDQATSGRRFSLGRLVTRPATNPLTVASVVGLLLAVTGLRLPGVLRDPLELVGGIAVPAMLIAYGVSLRVGPRPGRSTSTAEIAWITVLKLLAQPVTAYAVGRFLLGLDRPALLAVTVIAALPTAQNIFVTATRYGRAQVVARDAIFVTTLLSVPVMVAIAAVLA